MYYILLNIISFIISFVFFYSIFLWCSGLDAMTDTAQKVIKRVYPKWFLDKLQKKHVV